MTNRSDESSSANARMDCVDEFSVGDVETILGVSYEGRFEVRSRWIQCRNSRDSLGYQFTNVTAYMRPQTVPY